MSARFAMAMRSWGRTCLQYGFRAGSTFGVVTAVAVGQAVAHHRSYEPLPQPSFAHRGLESPERRKDATLELSASRVREKVAGAVDRALLRWRSAILARTAPGLEEGATGSAAGAAQSPRHAGEEEKTPEEEEEKKKKKKCFRVLFLGDSLVTGVGGSQHPSEKGPPLPRRVCRALADRLGVEVEWRALGRNGCDVAAMRSELVPALGDDHRRESYDVAVVMCGLNDFKHLARGEIRTPWAFAQELNHLVAEIRSMVGEDCRIVLPALPVALAAFDEPLRSYVVFIADLWDSQKQHLASRLSSTLGAAVEFVDVFRLPEHGDTLLAADGVHPNENGYELWAQHIAVSLLARHSKSNPQPDPDLRWK